MEARMPFVRISLRAGTTPAFRKAVGDAVHQAMVETINVPAADKFQVITEHDETGLGYDPNYLGIARTDAILFVQITLNTGRTTEMKKAFYARAAALLSQAGARPEDVFIGLIEVQKENWSFGNGIAQYA